MKKNIRNLIISVLAFIILILAASLAYNSLKDRNAEVAYKPELKVPVTIETTETVPELPAVPAPEPQAVTVSAAAPAPDQDIAEPQAEPAPEPKMPDIPLTRLDGTKTSFDAVRQGKPVVINYFASWCPPCKQELPYFLKAYEKYKDQVAFIFIDSLDGSRETEATIKAFVKDFPFTGPVYFDDGIFAYMFQTTSLPTTVFFASDGTVVSGHLGLVSEEVLIKSIEAILP
ncbi:Redoxin [Sphaerochaeta pleomorpha str. Grapes]|uniref:Redoxin n=1 Tax=Sphaerochaeta pleomorpha (strain ATCC BAA-1885 / DSM 22778 / Grapes) TaxID=158190 RepID=G8QY24_SPHPG|nr:redoxin domain-containing protein [Sphaerochaeta pleomorpha]AEV28529.1 Redoxin [Sphaerochaeta pleomorpha str. Grapes]